MKNSARWEAAASNTDVTTLLLIIRDIIHNKRERAQITMDLVESNAALYTPIMKGNTTPNEYNRVFKAQIDTIEVHDGNPGYHLSLAQEHTEA